jgi:hypothetical protein
MPHHCSACPPASAAAERISKRDADNERVEAALRRRAVSFRVAAESSRLRWQSKFEVVKRSRRVQLHQFEQRRDASEVKMKRLDEQLEEKKALFQQKRCASHRGVPAGPASPSPPQLPPPCCRYVATATRACHS